MVTATEAASRAGAKPRARFWLVWREHGGAPTNRHVSKALAEQEAERLATRNPGASFFVMEAVSAVQTDAVIRWIPVVSDGPCHADDDDDTPF